MSNTLSHLGEITDEERTEIEDRVVAAIANESIGKINDLEVVLTGDTFFLSGSCNLPYSLQQILSIVRTELGFSFRYALDYTGLKVKR